MEVEPADGLNIRRKINQLFTERFGAIPGQFTWAGRPMKPTEFAARLNLPRLADYDMHNVREGFYTNPPDRFDLESSPDAHRLNDNVWARFKASIDQGLPVLGMLNLELRNLDKTTGVLSKGFVAPLRTDHSGRHLVVFTGYELDAFGHLAGLFFQNSWGVKRGIRGNFEVMTDYLLKHDTYLLLPNQP